MTQREASGTNSSGEAVTRNRGRRIHTLRLFLFLTLVSLLLGGGIAGAAPIVTGYDPSSVAAGGVVTMTGSGFGADQGDDRSIHYGRGGVDSGTVGRVERWGDAAIRVRLPAGIPSGRYWLAIYRRTSPQSNRLETLTVGDAAGSGAVGVPGLAGADRAGRGVGRGLDRELPPLPAATLTRVTGTPECAGSATVRIQGGPFTPGTGLGPSAYGPVRWTAGRTFAEIRVCDPEYTRFWNRLIYATRVIDERTVEVELFQCIVFQSEARIRLKLPDGTYTNWVGFR